MNRNISRCSLRIEILLFDLELNFHEAIHASYNDWFRDGQKVAFQPLSFHFIFDHFYVFVDESVLLCKIHDLTSIKHYVDQARRLFPCDVAFNDNALIFIGG